MEKIEIGSVVHLNGFKGIAFTVINYNSLGMHILGYDGYKHEFVEFKVSPEALSLVK